MSKVVRFNSSDASRISNDLTELRRISPNSSENLSFRSANTGNSWWKQNPDAIQKIDSIVKTLIRPLPQKEKNQIHSILLYTRHVRNILNRNSSGRTYINRQTLHVNFETNPLYGEAFKQILYYVETPRYSNGRGIANSDDRGELLLKHKNTNSEPIIITPEKGQAVYFNPLDVYHEVLPPSGNSQRGVDRNMVILFLYKKTESSASTSQQIRNYPSSYPGILRALAGYIPRTVRRDTSPSLTNTLRRLTIKPSRKRKRSPTPNQHPIKRARKQSPHKSPNRSPTPTASRTSKRSPISSNSRKNVV